MQASERYFNSVVEIINANGAVIGAGILIDSETVLTCAHVVSSALGMGKVVPGSQLADGAEVTVRRSFLMEPADAARSATIANYIERKTRTRRSDIAVLTLKERIQDLDQDQLAPFGILDDIVEARICTLGFPADARGTTDRSALAYYKIEQSMPSGWIAAIAASSIGQEIREGFSGSAVMHQETGLLLGMVSEADSIRRTATFIPAEVLSEVLPNLKITKWSKPGDPSQRPVFPRTGAKSEAGVRRRYLEKAKKDFDERLRSSIHFIDLDVRDEPQAIRPAWGFQTLDGSTSYKDVAEAFTAAEGRLLILGKPGSGKSTALVHLAKKLLVQAETDADAPLPFYVSLSKFQWVEAESRTTLLHRKSKDGGEKQDTRFEDWLTGEMAAFPGLTRKLASKWIRHGRVAVLLDALDEFNEDRRAALVRLLNKTFLRDYPEMIVVVCSRSNDYDVLRSEEENHLQLNAGVELEPLTDEQIFEYLESRDAVGLRAALPSDPDLMEMARTPLLLSVLLGAFGRSAPENLGNSKDLSQRRHKLFGLYVERMLQREARKKKNNSPLDDSRVNDVPTSQYLYQPKEVQRWLGWLAIILSMAMKTTFSISGVYKLFSTNAGARTLQALTFLSSVYIAVASLMSISLLAVWLAIAPWELAQMSRALYVLSLASVLLVAGKVFLRPSKAADSLLYISVVATVMFDVSLFAVGLVAKLPLGISPIPASVAIVVAFFAIGTVTSNLIDKPKIDQDTLLLTLPCVAGLILAVAWHFLSFGDRFGILNRHVATSIIAGAGLVVGAVLSTRKEDLLTRLLLPVLCGAILIAQAGATSLISIVHPVEVFSALAATSALVLGNSVIAAGVALQTLLAVCLVAGGIMDGTTGAVIAGGACGGICLLSGILLNSQRWRTARTVRGVLDRIERRLLRGYEAVLLGPVFWSLLALSGRAPWRRMLFLRHAKDAVLLKQSGTEFEFVHRLLRDYFAVSELLPAIQTADPAARLNIIRSLGYQGESAIEVLADLAENPDAHTREAAVIALSHIASPLVWSILRRRLYDAVPIVRHAVIRASIKLTFDEWTQLANELKPLGDGSEVDTLLEFAKSEYRGRAAYLLEKLGRYAVPALLARLADPRPKVREMVVAALGAIKDTRSVGPLMDRLLDKDTAVKAESLKALGALHDLRALEPIIHVYIAASKLQVRIAAAKALGELGEEKGFLALMKRLKEDLNVEERVAIASVLGKWAGDESLSVLRTLSADRIPAVRLAATQSLKHQAANATGLLLDRLVDRDPKVRQAAVEGLEVKRVDIRLSLLPLMRDSVAEVRIAVLEKLGTAVDPDRLAWLKLALEDKDAAVRSVAVRVLGGLRDQNATEPLLRRLEDTDATVRAAAAGTLGVWLHDQRAVGPLLAILHDQNARVRANAAESLGELANNASVEPLIGRLQDQDVKVRTAVAESLGKFGDARAVEPLIARLQDQDPKVRATVAQSLGKLGDPRAVEPLLARLQDQDIKVRAAVSKSLGKLGDARAVEPLLRLLTDVDFLIRANTIPILGKLCGARAIAYVLPRLEDEAASVRRAAANFIGLYGESESVNPLLKALSDSDHKVRVEVINGLRRWPDARTVPALLPLTVDENEEVAVHAASAVWHLKDSRGRAVLEHFLVDPSVTKRRLAVELMAAGRDFYERLLLGEYGTWIDPLQPISPAMVAGLAKDNKFLTEERIQQLFRALQPDFHLSLQF